MYQEEAEKKVRRRRRIKCRRKKGKINRSRESRERLGRRRRLEGKQEGR